MLNAMTSMAAFVVPILMSATIEARVLGSCEKEFAASRIYSPTSQLDPPKSDSSAELPGTLTRVVVRMFDNAGGNPSPDLNIAFRDGAGSLIHANVSPDNPHEFVADLAPREYVLEALDGKSKLVAPKRTVRVSTNSLRVKLGSGDPGSSFFRIQDSIVPFEPSKDLIAISFGFAALSTEKLAQLVATLTRELPLSVEKKYGAYGRSIENPGELLLLSIDRRRQPDGLRSSLIPQIRRLVPATARVGVPLNPSNGAILVIDNQFIVRLTKSIYEEKLADAGAVVLRKFSSDTNVIQIQFDDDEINQNLLSLECLIDLKYIDIAEPDLIFELTNNSFASGFPNDPRFNSEQSPDTTGFGRQRFWGAWRLLDDKFHFPNIGRTDVRIAVLEVAVASGVTELSCNASDGQNQIAMCWNATNGTTCGPVTPNMAHGLAVLGIIAACVHNSSEIAGMAPGTKKMVIQSGKFPSSSGYADLLQWIGGLPVSCAQVGVVSGPCTWAKVPNPAWIINASHTICEVINNLGENGKEWCIGPWWDLPTSIHIALKSLWMYGRTYKGVKRGVVPVYASGNAGQSTLDQSPFARSPFAISVSNCMIDGAGERIVLVGDEQPLNFGYGSNYGKEIDVCALGHKIPTIPYSMCLMSPGGCLFGATSAATPQVSSAIGLLLSANPELTSSDVRDTLRKTADKIDLVNGGWSLGRSPKYGSGRLNACRAVKFSLGLPDPGPNPNLCAAPSSYAPIPAPTNLRDQQ